MGRSVDYASNAASVVYVDVSYLDDGGWDWDDFVDDVRWELKSWFKSFEDDDQWIGRELRSILENELAQIVISEYCGLASISLVAKEYDGYYSDEISKQNLANRWVVQIAPKFEKVLNKAFNGLQLVGRFSNGEAVYQKAA